MLSEFRHSARVLAKSPGFTAVAVLTLAIAIGANSAIFSLINSVLLRSDVPVRPAEVVRVFTTEPGAARRSRPFSLAEFATLRESHELFADVAAVSFAQTSFGRAGELRRVLTFVVSEN